ncbi:hypothetical protein OIU84_005719, partial [Salix udensis]
MRERAIRVFCRRERE